MTKRVYRTRRAERWWARLIERQARTGKSVVELCSDSGVSAQSFYWWRRKLSAQTKRVQQSFTEMEVGVASEYEIRLRNGRSVVVRGTANVEELRSVLMVTEEVLL